MEFKVVDYKIYFVHRTKEEFRDAAIEHDYSSKSKKWLDDFEGMLDKLYNAYSDIHLGTNKLLIKTVFVGEPYDINELYTNCKLSYHYLNRKFYKYTDNGIEITDDIIKSHIEIVKPNKPTTYPKYNNEVPFLYDKKYHVKIEKIYFDGYVWKYNLKNIGHVFDYISELELDKYNEE